MTTYLTFRRVLRGGRAVVLGGIVYSCGYSQGSQEMLRNSEKLRNMALDDTLSRLGSPRIVPQSARFHETAETVLDKVLESTDEHIRAQVRKKGLDNLDVERLTKALHRPWEVVVIEHPFPSAFVNPLLPDKIFVHTGLLKHGRGDGVVAMGIASELLASVLNSDPNHSGRLVAYAATAQLVVLAMLDPTGILTMLAEGLMFAIHEYGPPMPVVMRSLDLHLDPHTGFEVDADALKIAARAGYRPDAALGYLALIKKVQDLQQTHRERARNLVPDGPGGASGSMAEIIDKNEEEGTSRRTFWAWFSLKPPSNERLEALEALAGPEGAATALYLAALSREKARQKALNNLEKAADRVVRPRGWFGGVGRLFSGWSRKIDKSAKESGGLRAMRSEQVEAVGWSAAFLAVLAVAEAMNRHG